MDYKHVISVVQPKQWAGSLSIVRKLVIFIRILGVDNISSYPKGINYFNQNCLDTKAIW